MRSALFQMLTGAFKLISAATAIILFFAGGIPLFNQILHWLREGIWYSHSLRNGLEYIGVLAPYEMIFEGWVGLSTIAEWFLDIHTAWVCIPLAVVFSYFVDEV